MSKRSWRWAGPGLLFAAVILGIAVSHDGGNVTAQQPSPTASPTPALVATLAKWQLVDPTFAALPGAKAYWGVLDRSAYHIEVPDNWNGELVMYAHGYAGEGTLLRATASPIRQHLISLGYAWAASSYQENGYDPDLGVQNTLDLRDFFIAHWGSPRRTYLEGTSMGGHIVVSSLEQHPGVYDGALAECGVLMQEQEADYLGSFSAVADYVSGAHGLPAASTDAFADLVKSKILPALGTPQNFTDKGQAFESVIKYLSGGPRPFRHQGLIDFYTGAFGAVTSQPGTSLFSLAATNDYFTFQIDPGLGFSDDELNSNIYRFPPEPYFRNQVTNPTFTLPTGLIDVPLLTYHTTGDNFVPIMHEINYRKTVNAAGHGDLIVQRGVRAPDHCQFQPADLEQGFDDLVSWVEHGAKPAGDDFLAPDLTTLGQRWTHQILPGDDEGF